MCFFFARSQINRTFNEFENSQNNNGPISAVDMENIQNNNAMDYIANRNEINIIVEPAPHPMNRNFVELSGNIRNSMNATTSTAVDQFVPTPSITEYENVASSSDFDYQLNEFNECRIDQTMPYLRGTATASESLNNYIDLEEEEEGEDDDSHIVNQNQVGFSNLNMKSNRNGNENEIPHSQKKLMSSRNDAFSEASTNVIEQIHDRTIAEMNDIEIDGGTHKPMNHLNVDINHDSINDDAISIEEALRALDFAISGGESIHPDFQDSYSSDESENDCEMNDIEVEVKVETEEKQQQQQPQPNAIEEDQQKSSSNECKEIECTSTSTSTELMEIANAKDIITENEAEQCANSSCSSAETEHEHSQEYVYEVAKELIDSVLEECTQHISLLTRPTPGPVHNELIRGSHNTSANKERLAIESIEFFNLDSNNDQNIVANANADSNATVNADATIQLDKIEVTDLDDTMDETFVIGKLEASTPCHKNFATEQQHANNQLRLNLFQTLDEVNESALSLDGVEPLQTTYTTQLACTTFEVQQQPDKNQLASTFVQRNDDTFVKCSEKTFDQNDEKTFVKSEDKTFVAANQLDQLQNTFNVECNEAKPQNTMPRMNPTIKIDKEELNSDDLTTITPMNTPIELNYVGESWDQFISKSMNKKSIDALEQENELLDENIDDSVPTTLNSKNAWFLHPQHYDADCSSYDGMDEEESESADENPELLSLTFDALRKQLADVLPQASGNCLNRLIERLSRH